MARLKGRTAIVTGGATGLGRHYSEVLAREGANVAILDVSECDAVAVAIDVAVGRGACLD